TSRAARSAATAAMTMPASVTDTAPPSTAHIVGPGRTPEERTVNRTAAQPLSATATGGRTARRSSWGRMWVSASAPAVRAEGRPWRPPSRRSPREPGPRGADAVTREPARRAAGPPGRPAAGPAGLAGPGPDAAGAVPPDDGHRSGAGAGRVAGVPRRADGRSGHRSGARAAVGRRSARGAVGTVCAVPARGAAGRARAAGPLAPPAPSSALCLHVPVPAPWSDLWLTRSPRRGARAERVVALSSRCRRTGRARETNGCRPRVARPTLTVVATASCAVGS